MITTDILQLSLLLTSSFIGAVVAAPASGFAPRDGTAVLGPELIVVLHKSLAARGEPPSGPTPNPALLDILKKHNAAIAPVFSPSKERKRGLAVRAGEGGETPDLSIYFKVDAPEAQLESIADDLRKSGQVNGAYVRPAPVNPVITTRVKTDSLKKRQSLTPNFESHQGYFKPAPFGVGAIYGNSLPGGLGNGVKIVDIEYSWNFMHEDITQNQGGFIYGAQTNTYWSHGTGVAGIVGGDVNSFGVKGLAPGATFYGSSWLGSPSQAATIQAAVDFCSPGDIILLEAQNYGPVGELVPVEWYPDLFAIIKTATNKGVVVVEAAGNGGVNLDDPRYETPQSGFPSDFKNPFNMSNPLSNAILVGAGAPPPEHSPLEENGPARSRMGFSNYGSRVDVQAWGSEVTTSTTDGGELQNAGPNNSYTDLFSGTSSASAIIAGTAGIVMGNLRASNKRITSNFLRISMRNTGSLQQDGDSGPATERIGRLPDLAVLIPVAQSHSISL